MKLLRRGYAFQAHHRVPLRFCEEEQLIHLGISLHTDSAKAAMQKATIVRAEMLDAREAKLNWLSDVGAERLSATRRLAQHTGRTWYPMEQVTKLPHKELLARIDAVVNRRGEIDMAAAEALLNGISFPAKGIADALERSCGMEPI